MIFPLSSTGWNCTPHRAPIRRCRTRRTHQGAAPVVARGRGIHAVCSSASGNKAWERTQQASNLHRRKPMVRQRRTKSSWRPVRGSSGLHAMQPIDRVDLGRSVSHRSRQPFARWRRSDQFWASAIRSGGGRCDGTAIAGTDMAAGKP
jgi:hypothetical protein